MGYMGRRKAINFSSRIANKIIDGIFGKEDKTDRTHKDIRDEISVDPNIPMDKVLDDEYWDNIYVETGTRKCPYCNHSITSPQAKTCPACNKRLTFR